MSGVVGAARRRVLLHAIAFVVGFSMVFVSLGASFSAASAFLLDYRDWIRRVGGALIVIFGLYIAGLLRIGFFGRTQQLLKNGGAVDVAPLQIVDDEHERLANA